MANLKKLQEQIYQNKINKGFNTTDVYKEFCLLYEEVTEACRAHYKKSPDVGEELADIAIYLLSLAEILDVDLEKEILEKMKKNEKRVYKRINGVNTRIKDA